MSCVNLSESLMYNERGIKENLHSKARKHYIDLYVCMYMCIYKIYIYMYKHVELNINVSDLHHFIK